MTDRQLRNFYLQKCVLMKIPCTAAQASAAIFNFRKQHPLVPTPDLDERILRRIRARSSLDTLQERQVGLDYEEWRIVVACTLLNRTHGRGVRPMIEQLFRICPSPRAVISIMNSSDQSVTEEDLFKLIQPLGFGNRRLTTLYRTSLDFAEFYRQGKISEHDADWAIGVHGVGPYALDSLRIFRYDQLNYVGTDTWLNDYVAWRLAHV